MTPRTMTQLTKIVEVIETHASVCWEYNDEELEEIEMTKCDVAVDLRGAFLPVDDGKAFKIIKIYLMRAINQVFGEKDKNFLSLKVL